MQCQAAVERLDFRLWVDHLDFVKAMQDFQSGARPNTLMGPIAKGFSEAEIRSMASYFAKQPK